MKRRRERKALEKSNPELDPFPVQTIVEKKQHAIEKRDSDGEK